MKKLLKLKIIAFLFILCFSTESGLAQQSYFDNNRFVPPSPQAYSIAKYGDIPVGNFTGIPSISVPIWNITDHALSLPISLDYYAGGIKVDEVASFVGLGWSLQAGGAITRVVHGRGEYLSSSGEHLPRRINNINYTAASGKTPYQFIIDNSFQPLAGGQFDSEPDVFYYNFSGKSGKFYFDSSGQVILEKKEDLKIRWIYSSDRIERFLITDDKGNQYEFNDIETTNYGGNNGTLTSSWFLSKITTPTNNQIKFEYLNAGSNLDLARTYTSTYVMVTPQTLHIPSPNNVPAETTGCKEIRLHKITSSSGSVEFKYKNSFRQDLPSGSNLSFRALDEIVISYESGIVFKKFKIFTSYFEANDSKKYDGASASQLAYLNYRLRLDSVKEMSGDEQLSLPPYIFKYNGDDNPLTNDAYTLPYRLSPEQDHWGFYNKSGNHHLFPGNPDSIGIPVDMTVSVLLTTSQQVENGLSGTNRGMQNGANRSPDTAAMKANLLKEIIYPTHGSTILTFEANYLSGNFGGVRIKQLRDISQNKTVKEKNYTYSLNYNEYIPNTDYYRYYYLYFGVFDPNNVPGVKFPHLAQMLGLPSTASEAGVSSSNPFAEYIRISVAPQAVLGAMSTNGYSSVNVTDDHGTVNYNYDNFKDYYSYEDIDDYDLLPNIFENQSFVFQFSGTAYVHSESITSADWPHPEIFSNGWRRGTLTSVYWQSIAGKTTKIEKYYYTRTLKTAIPAGKIVALSPETGTGYITSRYFLPHGIVKLDSIITTNFDVNGNNPITTRRSYFYDNPNYTLASRISEKDSRGSTIWTQKIYPFDYYYGNDFIDSLMGAHIISYPIEEVVYKTVNGTNTILSGKISRYNSLGLKKEEKHLKINSPITLNDFKFSNRDIGVLPPNGYVRDFQPDTRYQSFYNFDKYDQFGNITEINKVNDLYESYKWDYLGRFPVMRVKNARGYPAIYGIQSQREVVTIPEKPDLSFSTTGGTIEISLTPNVGYIYKLKYDLTGPQSRSGVFCASGTNTACSSPGTISFNNMPAGDYTFSISDYESSGIPNKMAVISFDANVIVTPGHNDFFYEGFEENGDSSISPFAGNKYHSGSYIVPFYPSNNRNYLVDYRYLEGGTWKFKSLPYSYNMTLSGTAIDEVRVYPTDSEMSTYSYKPLIGPTSETDFSGKTIFYEYDKLGRLKLIKDANGRIIKDFDYNYGTP